MNTNPSDGSEKLRMPGSVVRLRNSAVSLYDVLGSRFGLYPISATETLLAVVVTNQEAALLRIPPGSPALAAQRVTLLPHGQHLEYAESIMRGDRNKVVLDLVRQP